MSTRIARIQVEIRVIDDGTPNTRWNGGPMASDKVHEAMEKAVDHAQESLREDGLTILGVGRGILPEDLG